MESQRRTTPVWVTRAFLFLISRDLLELASAESADSDVDANAAAVHASDRRKCAGSHTQNPRVCQTHSVRSSRVRGRERTSERSQRLRDCQRTSPADLSARTRQAGRQAMAEIDRWSSLARTARAQRTQCKHTRTAGERPSAAHPSLSLSLPPLVPIRRRRCRRASRRASRQHPALLLPPPPPVCLHGPRHSGIPELPLCTTRSLSRRSLVPCLRALPTPLP